MYTTYHGTTWEYFQSSIRLVLNKKNSRGTYWTTLVDAVVRNQ